MITAPFKLVWGLLLFSQCSAQAPGDEDERCQTSPYIHSYADNVNVLMDSYNYQHLLPGNGTGYPPVAALWNDMSFDGNDIISTTEATYWQQGGGGVCQFQVKVCGFRQPGATQDNWLFTQHISKSFDANSNNNPVEMLVNITYALQSCRERHGCNVQFELQYYITNNQQLPSTSGSGFMNKDNYVNFGAATPATTGAKYSESHRFSLQPQQTGFYIAVKDTGTCVQISRLLVYRHIVFQIVQDVRNETVTPEDSVSFTCSFFHDDANIDIRWAVGNSIDVINTLCGRDRCFMTTTEATTTTSTLTVDGNSLSIGTHDIKCRASVGDDELTSRAVLTIQQAGLQLIVNYPDASNRSFVELTCRLIANNHSISQVNVAKYERDNELITSNNELVNIIYENEYMISFFFTQDQEGWFRCTTDAVVISSAIALAAMPVDYTNEERQRYIAFLSSNLESPRTTILSCDIRPGKLEQFYTVEWVNISESGVVNDLPNDETYDFPIDIEILDNHRYHCIVNIQHRSDQIETIPYNGQNIVINKKAIVLPQITERIDDKHVMQGDHVKFICSFSHENDILDILWTVGNQRFNQCDFAVQDIVDRCSTTVSITDLTKTSTFAIQDTSSLPAGHYVVKCIAVSLSKRFTSDPSYIRDMFEVTNGANITIIGGDTEGNDRAVVIGGSVAAGIGGVVFLFAFVIIIILRKRLFHVKRKAVIKIQRSPFLMKKFEKQEKLQKYIIPQKSIRILKIIGEGEFGIVYSAHLVKNSLQCVTTLPVAVKIMKGFSDREKPDDILKEALQMHDLDHRNVMSLVGLYFANSGPCIVMPYMENGSLLAHLKKERHSLIVTERASEQVQPVSKKLLSWSLQTAEGMKYLACQRIVHKDLAARNCMLGENMIVKVADFGFSEKMYSSAYVRTPVGGGVRLPVKWMAPESIQDGIFSEKTDVWSFGVTGWEIFTGGITPYPGVSSSVIPQMRNQERRLNQPDNEACSDEMYGMMVRCWDGDPAHRPTFSDLVTDITSQLDSLVGGYLKITQV